MALLREIQHGPTAIFVREWLSGHQESGQVRFRATACQDATGLRRIAQELFEPTEDDQFNLAWTSGLQPNAGEKIRSRAEKVGQHRHEVRRARDEGQESWMIDQIGRA